MALLSIIFILQDKSEVATVIIPVSPMMRLRDRGERENKTKQKNAGHGGTYL